MKYKFNPLTWEFNLVPDSGTLKQKLNWLTGNFNLTKDASKYKQIYNVIEGEFNLYPATTQVIVHWVWSIQLTNAVENWLLSLKAFGWTEQRIKNLFDKDDSTMLFSGFINNAAVWETSKLIAYGGGDKTIIIKVNPNTTYTVVRATNLGNVYDRIRCASFTELPVNSSQGVILCNYMNATQASATFTTLSDTEYVAINVRNSGTVGDDWTQYIDTFLVYQWTSQTPTPTAPMDIVSNNWVLKPIHQSWLPIWYTLLDYIQSWWSNYIDTWIKLTNEDVVEMQYLQTADKWAIYWEYYNGTANMSTTLYWNITFYFYGYNAWWTATNVWNYDTNVHTVVHNFVDWYIDFDWVRTTFNLPNPNSFTNTLNCPIFWRSNGSSIWYFSKTQLYYFRIRRNWELILDLIPAKDSDNNVWMYDRVSWTLFTESWSWSFTAWNTVADPMTVYADWTTETIWLNLLDLSSVDNWHYYSWTGEYLSVAAARLSNFVSVKAWDTLSITTQVLSWSTLNLRYNFFDTSKQWLSQSTYSLSISEGEHTEVFTVQQDWYFAFSGNYTGAGTILDWNNVVIMDNEKNVTAEMLLKVWNYADEQEILSWNITRMVGIKVFDGTENWKNLSGYFNISKTDLGSNSTVMPSNSHNMICSHFEIKDGTFIDGAGIGGNYVNFKYDSIATVLANWKTWLADQYAAWTPVIIVYPLAEETTESVAGQTMNIPAWNSTIWVVQASLDNLELEATYEQEA